MAKDKVKTTAQPKTVTITEEYIFQGEKKTCWRYDCKTSVVNVSQFLKKKQWPEKPGDKVKITFQVESH